MKEQLILNTNGIRDEKAEAWLGDEACAKDGLNGCVLRIIAEFEPNHCGVFAADVYRDEVHIGSCEDVGDGYDYSAGTRAVDSVAFDDGEVFSERQLDD